MAPTTKLVLAALLAGCCDARVQIAHTGLLQRLPLVKPQQVGQPEQQLERYQTLMGDGAEDIAAKLNRFMQEHNSVGEVVPCSLLESGEVAALKLALEPHRDRAIHDAMFENDGRRLTLPIGGGARAAWHAEPGQEQALRNAICTEAVKLWAHHLPASAKTASANLTLPSLPVYDKKAWHTGGSLFNRTYGCVQGHQMPTMDKLEPWTGWPIWPLRGHFTSKGHGPFPFWHFGAPASGVGRNAMMLNVSVARPYLYNPGNGLEVWYDMSNKVTKFYHERCDLILVDISGFGSDPCVHLMTGGIGSGKWWLYSVNTSTKKSDGRFCCDDSFGATAPLGTLNARFMQDMYYYGEVDFEGDYFKGKAKRYQSKVLSPPSPELDVWYETDMEGRPLRFGEIGSSQAEHQPYREGGYLTSENLPLLYTDYDFTSWEFGDGAVADLELDVPEVCTYDDIPDCKVPAEHISKAEVARTGLIGHEHWPECAIDLERTFAGLGSVQDYDVCDATTGRLLHGMNSTMNHGRPQLDCHEYVVVHPTLSARLATSSCEMGSPCQACKRIEDEMVLARVAVLKNECKAVNGRCFGRPRHPTS